MQQRKALEANAYAVMILLTALVWLLSGPLTGSFAAAALLVGAGIVLVNLRR